MGDLLLSEWVQLHTPAETMNWRGAFDTQVAQWHALGERLGKPLRVVNTHRSKSIDLPVVRVEIPAGFMLLRDNFHDINIHVASTRPLAIPLSRLYPAMTWDQYLHDIERCRGYTYRGWTDEQMADPCVLRAHVRRDDGSGYWSEVSGKTKDRWLARMESPEWYTHDWSSADLLVDGVFGPGCTLYRAERAFSQGLPDAEVYRPPTSKCFTVAVGADQMDAVVDAVIAASLAALGASNG